MPLSDEQLIEILGGDIPAKTLERLREAIEQNERPDPLRIGAEEVERILKECSFDSDPYLQTR